MCVVGLKIVAGSSEVRPAHMIAGRREGMVETPACGSTRGLAGEVRLKPGGSGEARLRSLIEPHLRPVNRWNRRASIAAIWNPARAGISDRTRPRLSIACGRRQTDVIFINLSVAVIVQTVALLLLRTADDGWRGRVVAPCSTNAATGKTWRALKGGARALLSSVCAVIMESSRKIAPAVRLGYRDRYLLWIKNTDHAMQLGYATIAKVAARHNQSGAGGCCVIGAAEGVSKACRVQLAPSKSAANSYV